MTTKPSRDEKLWTRYARAALPHVTRDIFLSYPQTNPVYIRSTANETAKVVRAADAMLAAHKRRWPDPEPTEQGEGED